MGVDGVAETVVVEGGIGHGSFLQLDEYLVVGPHLSGGAISEAALRDAIGESVIGGNRNEVDLVAHGVAPFADSPYSDTGLADASVYLHPAELF